MLSAKTYLVEFIILCAFLIALIQAAPHNEDGLDSYIPTSHEKIGTGLDIPPEVKVSTLTAAADVGNLYFGG